MPTDWNYAHIEHYTSDRVAVQYWLFFFVVAFMVFANCVYCERYEHENEYEQTMCARACAQRVASMCVLRVFDFSFCEFHAVRLHCDRESSVIIMIMIFLHHRHITKHKI